MVTLNLLTESWHFVYRERTPTKIFNIVCAIHLEPFFYLSNSSISSFLFVWCCWCSYTTYVWFTWSHFDIWLLTKKIGHCAFLEKLSRARISMEHFFEHFPKKLIFNFSIEYLFHSIAFYSFIKPTVNVYGILVRWATECLCESTAASCQTK